MYEITQCKEKQFLLVHGFKDSDSQSGRLIALDIQWCCQMGVCGEANCSPRGQNAEKEEKEKASVLSSPLGSSLKDLKPSC